MIVVTGAAGFIGSCLVSHLNQKGFRDIILVDDFSSEDKNLNFAEKRFSLKIDRMEFPQWLKNNNHRVKFVFHIGARTDTTELDTAVLDTLNLNYSKTIWQLTTKYNIPFIYASSAATYGNGKLGYDDNHDVIAQLKPLNPYGISKNEFDKWVLQQKKHPPYWAGLKFFNVYGPNEYHKGRMASVILHAFKQIKATGGMKLFRSHHPDYKDGEQLRDFIYVKDVVSICYFLMQQHKHSGIYNVGTGKAQTFVTLALAIFDALGKTPNITYVDTPEDIRDKYQYFTQANTNKLRSIGYTPPFYDLEKGVKDYVSNYLLATNYL